MVSSPPSNNEIVLLQHEKGVIEDLGRTGIKVAGDHLAVDLAHYGDLLAGGVDAQVARKGEGLEESAALVGDADGLAAVGSEEEYFEVPETDHHVGVVEIIAVDEHLTDLVLKLQACETCCVDGTEDREFDVAVLVHEVAEVLAPAIADGAFGGAVDVERLGEIALEGGNDYLQFVVGGNNCLKTVLKFNLCFVLHILKIGHLAGGYAGSGRQACKD